MEKLVRRIRFLSADIAYANGEDVRTEMFEKPLEDLTKTFESYDYNEATKKVMWIFIKLTQLENYSLIRDLADIMVDFERMVTE